MNQNRETVKEPQLLDYDLHMHFVFFQLMAKTYPSPLYT